MRTTSLRLALAGAVLLLVLPSSAAAAAAAPPPGPTGLKGFLLRATEPRATSFPRTPSFAWNPVRGAVRYEFQLATSTRFNEGSLVWSNVDPKTELAPDASAAAAPAAPAPSPPPGSPTASAQALRTLNSPAVALDVSLPWITGQPHALYARVRAVLRNGATRWSAPYGFDVRWNAVPQQLPSVPGLVRWTPVDGAVSYEVWLFGARRTFVTSTNVADQRDLWSFHPEPAWTGIVRWRVRAIRHVYGEIPNGLPAVTYGPWSPIYQSVNPPLAFGAPLTLSTVISEVQSLPGEQRAHQLTPGFAWTGTLGAASGLWLPPELFRVYVATDRDCVNVVFRGAATGSPA